MNKIEYNEEVLFYRQTFQTFIFENLTQSDNSFQPQYYYTIFYSSS